jgi:hypothetical protein
MPLTIPILTGFMVNSSSGDGLGCPLSIKGYCAAHLIGASSMPIAKQLTFNQLASKVPTCGLPFTSEKPHTP